MVAFENVRMAIVHDMIVDRGGAERVLLYLHKAFPHADIFTTAYLPQNTYEEFQEIYIRSTWYDKLVFDETYYRKLYFPFGLVAAHRVDLRAYDIVLQSTTHGAKYARVSKDALVISYCHAPFRLAWNPSSYSQVDRGGILKKAMYRIVINYLRRLDYKAAQRVDVFWTNTKRTAERIHVTYGKEVSKILNPPVDCSRFYVSNQHQDYFLVVSRLESYKRVELAIQAFNYLGFKLRIVGRGTQKEFLHSLANKNIEFLENISDQDLAKLYSQCRALIFPQEEDYGITPLEANASGRPVIAFGRGGILETMIPFSEENHMATALFFQQQSVQSLIGAVNKFRTISFDPNFIRKHAEEFDISRFVDRTRSELFDQAQKYFD